MPLDLLASEHCRTQVVTEIGLRDQKPTVNDLVRPMNDDVDPAPSGGRALRLSSCHTRIACHGKAASPVVGRAAYALLPEVSFSCPLLLLRSATLADM